MAGGEDPRVPLDVPALLKVLVGCHVDFILAGSVAVQAWGVDVGTPGDIDIVPATDRKNLARLAGALDEVDARSWPVTGQWAQKGGEAHWQEFPNEDPRRGQHLTPDTGDIATFDSLFSTQFGELDIVPWISGTYEWLEQRAVRMPVCGVDGVLVTHVDDLLALLTIPRRSKDAERVRRLREAQRRTAG